MAPKWIRTDPIHANKKINAPAPVQGNANKVPSPSINNLTSRDNHITVKNLAVVASRVPENAPSLADLLLDGENLMLLKSTFPNVDGATLAKPS